MKTMKKSLLSLLLTIIIFGACKKDKLFEPAIVNQPDNFSFQANNAGNVTGTYEYTWTNSGTKANITISTQGQAAQMDVKVYDASGNEVYSNSLDNNGSFMTDPGVAGQWRIVVILKSFSGTINISVQKAG